MYKLDDHLPSWIEQFSIYESDLKASSTDYEKKALKIMYATSIELYMSILDPSTTQTVKAILTRSLIECYADVFAVFRHENPAKKAKKYVKYAEKLNQLFEQQATGYVTARDNGQVTTRAFELAKKSHTSWNGMNVLDRVENIDGGRHVIGYYEFFSLFTHVNPSRQQYLEYFDNPVIAYYNSYIMLLILQALVSRDFIPQEYFISLNGIAAEYSAHYIKTDFSPQYPEN